MDNKLYELSNAQKRIYVTQQLFSDKPINNITGHVVFDQMVDIPSLEVALKKTIDSMDSLSIHLIQKDGEVFQYFLKTNSYSIAFKDFSTYQDVEKVFKNYVNDFARHVFPLFESNLYKIDIFKLDENKCGYAINFHHIVADGWSIKLFVERVGYYYNLERGVFSAEEKELIYYRFEDYLEKEKEYLKSEKALKDKKLWLEELKKHNQICDKTIGRNCSEGERITRTLSMEMKQYLSELNTKGYDISSLIATAFSLMIYITDHQYAPFLSIPIFNRVNKCTKETAGMFTSTVVLGIVFEEETTLEAAVKKMMKALSYSLRYQQFPYNLLFGELKNENPDLKDLYQFSINCYNMNLNTSLEGVKGEYYEHYQGHQAIPLQVIYKVWNKDEYTISIDYRQDCFEKQEVWNLFLFIEQFVQCCSQKPNLKIKEFKNILIQDNLNKQNKIYYVQDMEKKSFSELLCNIVACSHDRIAIYGAQNHITYGQFKYLIENAIEYLQKNSIVRCSKVILLLENSFEYVVYAIACLAMRAVIIPLDVKTKKSQLDYIVENCGAKIIITHLKAPDIQKHMYLVPVLDWISESHNNLLTCLKIYEDTPENRADPAYIIYTSGTTGQPKGVLIKRESITNYLNWAMKLYCTMKRTFYMFSSPAFDLSITTLLLPYISGESVVVDYNHNKIHEVTHAKYASKINIIKGTPSQLELLLAQDCAFMPLEVIISGGEELTVSLARRLTECFGKKLQIFNEYGPTEATIGCMSYLYMNGKEEGNAVPIGKATPGTNIYLVKDDKVVYGHGIGEIYIEGIQLSPGYMGLKNLNEEYFVNLNFTDKILYKTGDLAYWNEQGQLEYLGRKERQYKVNGFRVELNSIENVIKNMEGVQNCIVVVDMERNVENIIAVVQTHTQTKESIIEKLSIVLPDYYMPHHVYVKDSIPLAASGKIDYSYIKELKDEMQQNYQSNAFKNNKNIELILYQACEEILKSGLPMKDYSLINAGGDSIKSILISANLQEYGIHISLSDLLMHPKLDELVNYVETEFAISTMEVDFPDQFDVPANVILLGETVNNFNQYVQSMLFTFKKDYEINHIKIAWSKVMKQFPILSYILLNNKLVLQDEVDRNKKEWICYLDNQTEEERYKKLEEVPNASEQLVKLLLLKEDNQLFFSIQLHHVIADGITWKYILDAFYNNLEGKLKEVVTLVNYAEFAEKFMWKELFYKSGKDTGNYICIKRIAPCQEKYDYNQKLVIMEAVYKEVHNNTLGIPCELWVEWDARKMEAYKKFAYTIGCFSIFLPITEEKQITIEMKHFMIGDISLQSKANVIRLNYMGNIQGLVEGKFELLQKSLEISLRSCSGYGCLAEITAYNWDNELILWGSSRDYNLSEDALEHFLDNVMEQINYRDEDLVELSDEELEILYDE